jgi:hypothetical protein
VATTLATLSATGAAGDTIKISGTVSMQSLSSSFTVLSVKIRQLLGFSWSSWANVTSDAYMSNTTARCESLAKFSGGFSAYHLLDVACQYEVRIDLEPTGGSSSGSVSALLENIHI